MSSKKTNLRKGLINESSHQKGKLNEGYAHNVRIGSKIKDEGICSVPEQETVPPMPKIVKPKK